MFDDKQAVVFNEKYNETFNYFKYMLSISKDLPWIYALHYFAHKYILTIYEVGIHESHNLPFV